MKKLINLAFALLISAAAYAQGYSVQVCVVISGPQPTGPIVASLTYYSNGSSNSIIDTLNIAQLPYTHCFQSYLTLPDSGLFAFANGFVQLSTCAPSQVYNYSQLLSGTSTVTVYAQNCQGTPTCTASLTQIPGTNYLTASSTGIAPLSYSWDGGVTYFTNPQILMTGVGTYCVTVMDGSGCVATDCFTYNPICEASINVVGGGPYYLTATGTGTAPINYTWSTGDTSQVIVVNTTGSYCLTTVDYLGCVDTACVYLTVGGNCSTSIIQNTDTSGAYYLTALLDSTFSGIASYEWQFNAAPIAGATSANFYPTLQGTYCVTVNYNNGCTATNCYFYTGTGICQSTISTFGTGPWTLSVQSTGVAPYSYNWSTGETTSTILTTLAGDYCLVITDATGCEDSVCVTIGNTPPCNAYINEMVDPMGASYLLAMPDTFALGTVSYSWNTGETTQSIYPTQAGVYCVYILYSNTNCTGSYCFNYVPGNPIGGCSVYTTAIADSSLNNNFTFYAYPTGTAPFTYSWLFADGTTSTASAPSVQFANYLGVNWSSLTITDATGCVSSYCLVLPIVPPVDLCSADFSAYSNYQFGNPGEVFFQSYVQNVAGGAATYSWSFGDGSSSNLENPSHTYTTSGFYTICLTTTYNGCTYTSCKNEYVDLTWWTTNPFQGNCTASFMILTNQVANTGLINIINTSQGNNLYYTWSFGNGFISNSNLPFTTINNPGVYEICVSILDTLLNCSDTFCDTVTIDSLGNVYRDGMSGNIGILVSGTPQPNSILTTVDFKNSVNEINIAPNPSNGMFNLNSNWIEGTSLVEVFDIAGNIVRTLNINTTKGQKAVTIDLQDVADGSYLVRVVSNQRVQTVKLLVNH